MVLGLKLSTLTLTHGWACHSQNALLTAFMFGPTGMKANLSSNQLLCCVMVSRFSHTLDPVSRAPLRQLCCPTQRACSSRLPPRVSTSKVLGDSANPHLYLSMHNPKCCTDMRRHTSNCVHDACWYLHAVIWATSCLLGGGGQDGGIYAVVLCKPDRVT